MIVFDLQCHDGHRFEGWFGSSADYERQQQAGLVECPGCGSIVVGKAVMAPAIGRKGNQAVVAAPTAERAVDAPAASPAKSSAVAAPAMPPRLVQMMRTMATMQAKALESSRWVGERFADDARAMHHGEREAETIHGQASPKEAEALIEEGIVVTPLPFPVVPPEQAN